MPEVLRAGRKVKRTLYFQHGPAPSDDDTPVGMVDTPKLAAEICAAVNAARDAATGEPRDLVADAVGTTLAARIGAVAADVHTDAATDAVMQVVAPLLSDGAELERLRAQVADLSGAVWVHPGIRSGTPCIGGTRIGADQVALLMADVDPEDIAEYHPTVTPEGARAAAAFADRYVDRRDQDDEAEAARSARASVLLMRRELDQARALIADLASPDPCWHDHHGYCQAHGWFSVDPPCPHGRARQIAEETDHA